MAELIKQSTALNLSAPASRPFVTIAIPTLNRLPYLRETLASVFSQSYSNIEIIVSNNCSHDGTKEFLDRLNDHRLRIYHQETLLAMVANWNFLLEQANGEYFLLLSDDDLIGTEFVERCVGALTERCEGLERITVIYGSTVVIDSEGNTLEYWKDDSLKQVEAGEELVINWFKGRRPVSFCSTLFRTDAFRKIGGFDEANRYAADVVARVRLSINNQVLYAREAFAYYRIHDANATFQNFDPADRLCYNLDISLQAVDSVVNSAKGTEIKRAGEKYAKKVFITESAIGIAADSKFRRFYDFICAYLRHFTVAELLFFDLAHYLRRIVIEKRLRRLKRAGKSAAI